MNTWQKRRNLSCGVITKMNTTKRKRKKGCRAKENGGKASEMETMERDNGKDGAL